MTATASAEVFGSAPGTCPKSLGDALKELSEPWVMGDRIKAAIDRAAKRAGLSYWRTFDLWYGKARRVEQFEIDAIADALNKKRAEDARREFQDLKARLTRLESILVLQDPEFHRPTLDPLRESLRGPRRANRTVDG